MFSVIMKKMFHLVPNFAISLVHFASDSESYNQPLKRTKKNGTHLASEEAAMSPVNVLSKGHLQQGQPHVKRLNNVTFSRQGVLASCGFSARHLALDVLEAEKHGGLQLLEALV